MSTTGDPKRAYTPFFQDDVQAEYGLPTLEDAGPEPPAPPVVPRTFPVVLGLGGVVGYSEPHP